MDKQENLKDFCHANNITGIDMPKASYSTIKSILNFLKGNEEHGRKKQKQTLAQIKIHQAELSLILFQGSSYFKYVLFQQIQLN